MIESKKITVIRTGILCMLCVLALMWAFLFMEISLEVALFCVTIVLLPVSMVLQLWSKNAKEWVMLALEAVALIAVLIFTFYMF